MAQARSFNPTLRMSVVDVVVAVALIVATGYFWFETTGKARLRAGHQSLVEARDLNAREIEAAKQNLRDIEQELVEIGETREAKAQEMLWLEEQMRWEQAKILEYEGQDEVFTDQLLDLRLELQEARDRRMAYNTDIYEAEKQIAAAEQSSADLLAQVQGRNTELERLATWIAQAEDKIEADPPSRFPEHSSLASVVDMTDQEGRVMVSLARRVANIGRLDLGLLGSLGLSQGAESSVKEGGLFANLQLLPRRASIDFEGGISQLTVRGEDTQDTGPFAAATLRFAPVRRERLFLLAGTRYSHEDIGLRLGIGFGRR
ncbi:MAG: hypothetical protein V1774_01810 [Candidatus Eisenbacteria bacterium]